jgi:alpha-glucosidase
MSLPSAPWWRHAVVYQIYPRSFLDTDGDGVGDLEGIRRRLDHLAWLGVDALWLSPIYRSPMADFGYDIVDHRDVDPLFGDLALFDRLLAEAHGRGLRVLLDWVPNHTSDRHPWFVASRSSRDDPKRGWYVWRDRPNNWVAAFGPQTSAWTYDERTGEYYLHLFLPQQPDLDWSHPEVPPAMHDVLRFWLDRGVDGFRADVVHLIGKDPALLDDPPERVGVSRVGSHDEARTHDLLRGIRAVLDGYDGDRVMVGEVNLTGDETLARYYGRGNELHLVFNFGLLAAPWDARQWRDVVASVVAAYDPSGAWPTWVLSNHDQVRHRTRYGGTEARARAAAVALLTLPGTPFLYAGEELGLENAEVPPERVVDPGGRDGCRAPLPWDGSPSHGWACGEPWLPWPPHADTRNAAALRADEDSTLHLYRRLLAARRASPALHGGAFAFRDAPEGVLAWTRSAGEDQRAVVVNFTDAEQEVPQDGWTVEISSRPGAAGEPDRLAPAEARILRRGAGGAPQTPGGSRSQGLPPGDAASRPGAR